MSGLCVPLYCNTEFKELVTLPSNVQVDEKICALIKKGHSYLQFTCWFLENIEWAKKHKKVVHDITMTSISNNVIDTIALIERIVVSIWNPQLIKPNNHRTSSLVLCFENNLKKAIENNNKLLICVILFKYLESHLVNPDFVKKCLKELSYDEQMGFIHLKGRRNESLLHLTIHDKKNEIFNIVFNAYPKSARSHVLALTDHKEMNVLSQAILHQNSLAIKKILKHYPKYARLKNIKFLIKEGILQKSMENDQSESLIACLESGLKANERVKILKYRNNFGYSLLTHAIVKKFKKVVNHALYYIPKSKRTFVFERNPVNDASPIKLAVRLSSEEIVIRLLELVSSLNDFEKLVASPDRQGKNLLHYAVEMKQGLNVVEAIFKQIKNPSFLLLSADKNGNIPLSYAILKRNYTLISFLLNQLSKNEKIKAVNMIDSQGHSIWSLSLTNGETEIIKILLSHLPEEYKNYLASDVEELIGIFPHRKECILSGIASLILYTERERLF